MGPDPSPFVNIDMFNVLWVTFQRYLVEAFGAGIVAAMLYRLKAG